ncbi:MAG: Hsp20/alpha crystallin family protein [Nanoarchaeota archaeon]
MSFFDDHDPFEDIVNQFFGGNNIRRRPVRKLRESEEESSEFIEEKNNVYFITELPGYNEEDIEIKLKDDFMVITAKTNKESQNQDYMAQKHKEGITLREKIPEGIKNKDFKKTFRNGILEVTFNKK